MVYEALTDGTWDLWVARPDGSESHRSTNLPGSERSAAWHPRLPFIYFESDGQTIWRARSMHLPEPLVRQNVG